MTKIVAVALQKGGVGKTTTTQHLAHALADRGRKVLLIDLDQQGSSSLRYDLSDATGGMADVLGAEGSPTMTLSDIVIPTYHPNVFLAPSDERLAQTDDRLATLDDGAYKLYDILVGKRWPYDYIIIDTAPGKGKLLSAALVAADELIIPVQLSQMGFEGYQAIDRTIEQARVQQERTKHGMRLELRAIVPTFYSKGQITSDAFLDALRQSEHPDYAGMALPISAPVVETTEFDKASIPAMVGDTRRAMTLFELPRNGDDTPTARGQDAYRYLAEMVDQYV